jgi:glycosyltransferase involved in cell wall biosynthesis
MSTPLATRPDRAAAVATRPAPQGAPWRAPPAAERRVLVVVRWPLGGIRTHVLYNYPAAAGCGYRFTFVGPADPWLDTLADTLRGVPGCEYVGVPVHGPRCRLWPAVRRLARSGRFALMHSHGLTAGVHGVLANLGLGLPHLATVHDPLRPDQFPGLGGRAKRWLLGRAARHIDTLVAVSEDIRANLLEYLPPLRRGPGRVVTICNGIDVSRYAGDGCPAASDLRQGLGLGPETFLIGFLGRFMVQKGFLPLLEALQLLAARGTRRPFHLVAVGSGDYVREYRKQIGRRGLAGHVSLLDFVADVLPVLRQLDLLVVPSLWEASSLVSMEAMAAGVPVLGTDCIGLREVLRGTPARSVPAGDAGALCRGLEDAIAVPWTAEARAYAPVARERFDNTRAASRLIGLFDRALV